MVQIVRHQLLDEWLRNLRNLRILRFVEVEGLGGMALFVQCAVSHVTCVTCADNDSQSQGRGVSTTERAVYR